MFFIPSSSFFLSPLKVVTVIEGENKMVYRERWDEDKEAIYIHEIDGDDLITVLTCLECLF